MAEYDRLGPACRAAMQDAPINLGFALIRSMRRRYDDAEIAQTLKESVRAHMLGRNVASTIEAWTYTIQKAGLLWAGLHRGEDHPQAKADYPNPEYQLRPWRIRTRIVNIKRAKR